MAFHSKWQKKTAAKMPRSISLNNLNYSQIKTEVITQYSLTISNSTYLIMNYLAFLKLFF